MKIAILTQPLGHNYGGIMQAFALQRILKDFGHIPITIDRRPDKKSLAYRMVRIIYRAVLSALGARKELIAYKSDNNINTKNVRFIEKNISVSHKIEASRKLYNYISDGDFDAIIVGSDQVWRPSYSPNIYNFFLDFSKDQKIKKIAYAASFGSDAWEFSKYQTYKIRRLVKNFDFITVREFSGIELCKKNLGVQAHAVLDPTLLLDKSSYEDLCGHDAAIKFDYILTYFLDENANKLNFAEIISSHLNIQLRNISYLNNTDGFDIDSEGRRNRPGVIEWLSSIKSSKFVITDSYHGVLFSIIFRKPFVVINNSERGRARFESILSILGISNRLVSEVSPEFKPEFFYPIPVSVYEKIETLKNQSISMLNNALR